MSAKAVYDDFGIVGFVGDDGRLIGGYPFPTTGLTPMNVSTWGGGIGPVLVDSALDALSERVDSLIAETEKHSCGWCGGITYDDKLGHCAACGGPRNTTESRKR